MLTIIGCGNLNRRDDGVGVRVAQRLAAFLVRQPNPAVRVYDAGTGGMDVMFRARGTRSLVLIDASSTGSTPGAVYEVPGDELAALPEPGQGLHDFRWEHALYAGQKIFRDEFPRDVQVVLIEAADLSLGVGLSDAVERAMDGVIVTLEKRIAGYTPAAP